MYYMTLAELEEIKENNFEEFNVKNDDLTFDGEDWVFGTEEPTISGVWQ